MMSPMFSREIENFGAAAEQAGLGSTWNHSVAWAAKTEETCEKLRKFVCFAIEP